MGQWFQRIVSAVTVLLAAGGPAIADADRPRVRIDTSAGSILLELYPQRAPETVANFKDYVREGFYAGTIFHRVIPGFMIQGGGFTADMTPKETREPVTNEADTGLANERGTIAMARTSDPHSATSQFFVNLKDNDFLDHRDKTPRGWGYCAFGRVIEGMDVVDRIAQVETQRQGRHENVPVEPIVIESAQIVGGDG